MTIFQQLAHTQAATEVKKNKRLQWMLVAIFAMLSLSVCKYLNDAVIVKRSETLQQMNLLARLQSTAHLTIDPKHLDAVQKAVQQKVDSLPAVSSASTAEAKALTDIEKMFGSLITRKRVNLLGSDPVSAGGFQLWSVRVNVAGQLIGSEFITFLNYFEQSNLRIASLQYSPKTSDSVDIVIDMLYKREDSE